MFDDSLGNVLPTDIAQMTVDQFLVLWLERESFGAGSRRISHEDAVQRGLVEPGPSGVQVALAEAERLKKEQADADRRRKRQERRARRRGANV